MSIDDSPGVGQPPAKSNTGRRLLGCVGVIVVLGCLGTLVLGYFITQAGAKVEDGLAAMSQGDCDTAITHFDEVIGSSLATEENKSAATAHKQVCVRYMGLVGQQETGDLGSALVGYDDLIAENSDSALVPAIEQQARTVFVAEPGQVANPAVCQRLDSFVERNWVPNLDANLPLYYQSCGQVFTGTGDYSRAVAMYQRFVTAYPSHPAFEAVEADLARASVAEARQAGAGTIAPPQSVGGSGTGSAVVVIQNDSTEQISLVFSGPEARFETLEVCSTCIEYTVAPEFCPEEGPIGTYELPPGTYDVVVKSISDEGVIPFTGTWELAGGEEYYSCFFLITE